MRLFFSVGEPSGDVHTAHLIEALQRRDSNLTFRGLGGPNMAKAGCQLDYPLTDLAVMGFLRVVPMLGKFYAVYRRACRLLDQERPDAVILVDFPGFNGWIANAAKQRGIPVYYYLPPQLWAWASWRVKALRRKVDQVFCCFPFEEEWFRGHGIPAEYVGHPVFDEIDAHPLDQSFLADQAVEGVQTVAILPGSRRHEVEGNFPIQCEVMAQLYRRHPRVQFLVACFKESQRQWCEAHVAKRKLQLPVRLFVQKTPEILELADVCLFVSGSVSLEVLARAKPAVVLYRTSIGYLRVISELVACNYMTLTNLIAGKMLVPENAIFGNPRGWIGQMTDTLYWWLTDPQEYAHRAHQLRAVRDAFAVHGALGRAADAILSALHSTIPVMTTTPFPRREAA